MKKVFLFYVLAMATTAGLFAQSIPNSDFETWEGGEPQAWFTTNQLADSTVGFPNASKDSADVYSGKYAIQLATVSPGFAAIPGAAVAGTGTVNGLSVYLSGGFPYTTRAKSFTGFYEYTPGGARDSCLIQVWLFQRNPITHNRDTVARLTYKNGDSVTTFQAFSDTFTYRADSIGNETPDSALILLCSSRVLNISGIVAGSNLKVDDISFKGTVLTTGVKDIQKNSSITYVYPNPAANEVTLKTNLTGVATINVYDMLGKKVKAINVSSATITFPVNDLYSGLYFYQLINSREEILATGRFSVVN